MNESSSYEDGVRDGRMRAVEGIILSHSERLDLHEKRLMAHDRFQWVIIGAFGLMQVIPMIERVLK